MSEDSSNIWYRSSVSGLLYRNPSAAGDISEIVCNGKLYTFRNPNVGTVGHIDHGNTLGSALLNEFGGKEKTYTEAELQEKLRQQREACLAVWVDSMDGDDLSEAILNAKIDD